MVYLLKTLVVIDVIVIIALILFHWALAPRYRSVISAKIIFLALFTPVVALFVGNIYLFWAYLAAIVAFNSRSRAELGGNFVFLLPLMPLLSVETRINGAYLFAISTVLAMGLGALVGFLITTNNRTFTVIRYDMALLALVGIFMFIYNRDLSITSLLRGLTINVLSFVGPYLLISRSIRTAEDVERILLRLCLGGTILAVTALFQARMHWVLFQTYYETLHVPFPMLSWTLALRAGMLRTGGSMVDFGPGGLFLACVLTLMPFLRPHFRTLGFWVVQLVLVGGIIASQSRGAWVAAIGGIIVVLAYRGAWSKLALVPLLVASAIGAQVLLTMFTGSGPLAQIVGQTEEASGTVSYRKLLASRGLDQIIGHPIFGQHPDQLVANLPDLVQGEHIVDFVNSHLFIAMAAGIPLFFVWCWVWMAPVLETWYRRSRISRDPMEVTMAIIVPSMIALTFTSLVDRNLTWAILALGLAGPCSKLGQRRSTPALTVKDDPHRDRLPAQHRLQID
jgi:hypothetical protein